MCCTMGQTSHWLQDALVAVVLNPGQVLSMPPADVAERLVLLKELLPDSDVARMVELAPG